ncbi:MAG TPA: hypothetical protein VII38_23530 [Polyangia bacterium]|jgi:hypothetical protein
MALFGEASRARWVSLSACLALASCSAPPASSSGVPGDVHFAMSVDVPAGGEIYRCQYVTMPASDRYVLAAAHHFTAGSHHLLLYRTDLTTIPVGGDQIQDCYTGLGGTIMSHVRGVVYGSQVPDASFTMPSGVAFHMKASEVLLLQAHYLNATTHDLTASIDVGLTTSDGTGIIHPAGNLFYYDPFIDVPPSSTAKANARCVLSKDITLVNVFPHYHARGTGYKAWIDPPGQPTATPFYTSSDWEYPTPYQGQPLTLSAGTAIRWECDYTNTGAQEYFQGQSAAKNEMCMFTGLYYPAVDDNFELCLTAMDGFGSGGATCADTLTCIGQCPPASMSSGSTASLADIPDCVQKCVAGSCPSASQPLLTALDCIQAKCATACNGSDANACAQCVAGSCPNEYSACQSSACN